MPADQAARRSATEQSSTLGRRPRIFSRNAMSSESIHPNDPTAPADAADGSCLMAELSIAHAGRYYHFGGHRYERLEDAVAYAQRVGAQPSQQRDSAAIKRVDAVEPTDAVERQLMLELSISFENGCFVFEGYRYDRLIDAANYARHRRQVGLEIL